MTSTTNLHTLTGAYALDALDTDERRDFAEHLAHCPDCATEIREFGEAAARLGAAMSEPVPEAMKQAVLERIGSVRQLPPHIEPNETAGPGDPADRGNSGDRGGTGSRRRLHPRRWPRFLLAACLAAAALAGGGTALHEHHRADHAAQQQRQAEVHQHAVTALLAAPDAQTVPARGKNGSTGTVVVSRSRDEAAFLPARMAQVPKDRTYQLWLADGGTMRPAGLLAGGSRTPVLVHHLGSAAGVGVTVEPAGGSAHPTTQPVMLVDLPAAGHPAAGHPGKKNTA